MDYKTVSRAISVKQTLKKSVFIGSISPAESLDFAKIFISQVRKNYRDANHNAFAYRIGVKKEEFLFSDDGEPAKSAGLPIYNAMRSYSITNVVIVVTRYFGGVKLGIGGLIRAYGDTARLAIEASGVETLKTKITLHIELPYGEMGLFEYAVRKVNGEIIEKDFGVSPVLKVVIFEESLEEFRSILQSGAISIKIV